ncbi:MAG: hypothetical protein H0T79_01615 [Deltaproteobacteria bacterium]|nr:hypothetical protein [Deltaproteobacteria bacterium]
MSRNPWQLAALLLGLCVVGSASPAAADAPPHEFLDDARTLLVVGACAEGTQTVVKEEVVAKHCKDVRAAQDDYKTSWLAVAREFFAANVPKTIPKVVVYPFAGGDLSTALAVYPDATEITTLSLEPAGDPQALARLTAPQVKVALATVATELKSLYRSNFSVTMNMISAMRSGSLPTQLIFSLSALSIQGYELTALRYFKLTSDGTIKYVTDADLEAMAKYKDAGRRNRELANVEIKFKKKGGTVEQTYRHIMANLDDAHLKMSPAPVKHLEAKGQVAAMTKAASYLLTFGDFSTMRKYLIANVQWMVSDTTGLAPKYGTPAGFEYETWGQWTEPNMNAGYGIQADWKAEWKKQPKRELKFRFGYPDKRLNGHLIIMRKAAAK